jgi:DNA excision repair protein ERCC-4
MSRRAPSFHEAVDTDLKKRKADVIEFYQPLTPAMMEIQNGILDCMEATLSEIKRSNHYVSFGFLSIFWQSKLTAQPCCSWTSKN